MPAVSEKQRRYLNWRFGHAWTKRHHFDNKGALPEQAPTRRERMVRRHLRRKENRGQ